MNTELSIDQISDFVFDSSQKSRPMNTRRNQKDKKKKINFFFRKQEKENLYTFMLNRKLKQLDEDLKATKTDQEKKEVMLKFKYPKSLFGFTNNRKLNFVPTNQKFTSFSDYNRYKENILFNNVQNMYLLKIDFQTHEYFFSSILPYQATEVKLYLSANFFTSEFTNNLVLTSQISGVVNITDCEKQKKVSERKYQDIQSTFAFDRKYACVSEKGFIQFFDIRDDRKSIYHVQMHQFFSVDGDAEFPICNNIQYEQDQCLISGNTGTFYYDMRKLNIPQNRNNRQSLDINAKVQRGKKFSLTDQTIHGLENLIHSKNREYVLRKSFLLPNKRSFCFDYGKNNISIYDFKKPEIENQIHIQQNIIDFDYNKNQKRIALLEQPINNEQKVLFMSENLDIEETLIIKNKSFTKVGLFGDQAKFILHNKKDFQLFDMEKQVEEQEIPELIVQLEKKIPKN